MKFALVNTEPLELNRVVSSCWIPLLSREGDTWEEYRAYEGQLPARENLGSYAGLVLTGSSCSPMQTDDWVLEMKEWMKAVKEEQERREAGNPLRVLASCFSCQLTAATFGGAVAKNFVGHYIAKAEDLRVRPALLSLPWAAALTPLPAFSEKLEVPHEGDGETGDIATSALHMRVWESHGILVSRLPLGACRLADSPSSPNEIYTMGPDWLALQGHPEWSEEQMRGILRNEPIEQSLIEAGLATVDMPHDCDKVKAAMKAFVHADDVRSAAV